MRGGGREEGRGEGGRGKGKGGGRGEGYREPAFYINQTCEL